MTILLLAACAPALREPPPISALASGPASGKAVDELLERASDRWARRAEAGAVAASERLYLEAAAADARRVDGILGAMRAIAFQIEHDRDGASRGRLAEREVQLGQWCQRRAPQDPACGYRLAIALGQQARERRATGKDAMGKMVELLRAAIAVGPSLDGAGPHRVLALLLLRAPGWPVGPGDPEAGLAEAREAARRFPDSAENQLALGEALGKSGAPDEARAAYERALSLAGAAQAAGDPDAPGWRADASAALARLPAR